MATSTTVEPNTNCLSNNILSLPVCYGSLSVSAFYSHITISKVQLQSNGDISCKHENCVIITADNFKTLLDKYSLYYDILIKNEAVPSGEEEVELSECKGINNLVSMTTNTFTFMCRNCFICPNN